MDKPVSSTNIYWMITSPLPVKKDKCATTLTELSVMVFQYCAWWDSINNKPEEVTVWKCCWTLRKYTPSANFCACGNVKRQCMYLSRFILPQQMMPTTWHLEHLAASQTTMKDAGSSFFSVGSVSCVKWHSPHVGKLMMNSWRLQTTSSWGGKGYCNLEWSSLAIPIG